MPAMPDRLEVGKPYPLGASWDGLGVNFAVFSGHAERIDLCIFEPSGRRQIARFALPEYSNEIWHGYLPHASPGLVYGYRAFGPYDPSQGHRFNPAKLLFDPYAKALHGELHWTDSVFGYRLKAPRRDLSIDHRDSAAAMPKAVVADVHFNWADDQRPGTPWSQTVIYEAHVRGLTKLFQEVQPPERGTFAALCHPTVISYLQRLGITAIELMPVHAFVQDRLLLEKGLSNYWGYNTLAFFAPEPRYLSTGRAREMQGMVRRFHAAGIEVILDVVYNHTCEGSELGPTLCWRGLDNASYYRLAEDRRHTINDTGTGNVLNLSHPRVLQMVMDSLRYWATTFRVDGFRFDLATTIAREPSGFDPGSGFLDAIRQDPELSPLKLIAEPWDIGPGGYQLGRFPPGFSEWNDRFRDGIRRYWRGDLGLRSDIAARLSGSGDIFDTRRRRPSASVNYAVSHDGMTLEDLVSYRHKHNEANLEDNRDGHSDDHSSNWGAEGPTDDPNIRALRAQVKRSFLTAILGALGTPMLLSGDECGATRRGNNNAYCQDNELSWFDWTLPETPQGGQLIAFIARLIRLRRDYVTLRFGKYLWGDVEVAPGVRNLSWWDERGVELTPADWANPEGSVLVMRRAVRRTERRVEVTALLLNPSALNFDFSMPGQMPWRLLIDSAKPERLPHDIDGTNYFVPAHAAAVIAAELDAAS